LVNNFFNKEKFNIYINFIMQASSIGTLTKLLKNAREQRILDNFKKKRTKSFIS